MCVVLDAAKLLAIVSTEEICTSALKTMLVCHVFQCSTASVVSFLTGLHSMFAPALASVDDTWSVLNKNLPQLLDF